MHLQSLKARLPGSTDLELSGDFAAAAGAVDFTGNVRVTGRNLPRLVKWIYPGAVITTPNDPAFMIDAAVELGGEHIKLDARRAEIAGTSISGSLTFVDRPARSLDLKIAGNLLDLSDVKELTLPADGIINALVTFLGGNGGSAAADDDGTAAAAAWSLADAGLATAHIDARIGHLKSPGGSLRDIAADLTLADDRLTVGRLSVATEDGLQLSASGSLDKVTVAPVGQLGFEIDAGDQTAVAELERLIGNGSLLPQGLSQRRDSAPLRLAGIARFGERGQGSIDLNLDGSIGSSPAQLGLRVDGRQKSLGKRHIELSARLENASITRLLTQITGSEFSTVDTTSVDTLAHNSSAAAMDLRLSGVPDELMSCAFALDGGGIRADYDGKLRSAGDGIELDGGVRLSFDSLENAVTLAGLPRSGGLPNLPVTVVGELARSGNSYRLTKAKARLGDSEFAGTFSLGRKDDKSTIAVVGEVNAASLPTVLAAMFEKPGAAPSVAAGEVAAVASPWSSAPLSFAAVERLSGRVDLTFEQLELVEGLSLERARLAANLAGGKVEFETIEGSLLGRHAGDPRQRRPR